MKKILIFIFYLFFLNTHAFALVEIDITRGNLDPLPIAVSPLYIESGSKDIKQGEKIGTVGKTGRSTGPHLDIRLNWFNIKLDPATVLDLKKWKKKN